MKAPSADRTPDSARPRGLSGWKSRWRSQQRTAESRDGLRVSGPARAAYPSAFEAPRLTKTKNANTVSDVFFRPKERGFRSEAASGGCHRCVGSND